jgi:hypothetical protein
LIKHRSGLPQSAHFLIDEFMPVFDVSEYHETTVRAPIEAVYAALRTTDLGGSPMIKLLLRLRALPATFTTSEPRRNQRLKLNLDAILKAGFVLLGESPPNEMALGVIGRFWNLSGDRCRVNTDEFVDFDRPGYAKAVWNFSLVEETEGITRLATETRVRCMDDASRRRFRMYWALIAPFSGLIRREALRVIRRSSEFKL